MELQLIFYNTGKNREQFELMRASRPWHILLGISRGTFELEFPAYGEKLTVEPNEIVFLPANTEFIRTVTDPIDFYQFAFQTDDSSTYCGALPRGKLKIPASCAASAIADMERISEMPDEKELIIHEIRHLIMENYIYGEREQSGKRKISEDVAAVIRYMNANIEEKIDVDELADMVYLSHTGLIYKFRRQLETTPAKYLIMLRLRRAKQLLLEGALKINEIASVCGYKNAYYFSNAFKEYTGMSPTEFRRYYLDGNAK